MQTKDERIEIRCTFEQKTTLRAIALLYGFSDLSSFLLFAGLGYYTENKKKRPLVKAAKKKRSQR